MAANWTPAGLPDGVGNVADFSQQTLAADATVSLDGSHTVGNLIFGDQGNAYNWTLAPGSGGTLTLQVSGSTPTIAVNNQTTTIIAVLAGDQGVMKIGPGTLVLTASNIYSGGTTVSAGTLQLGDGLADSGYVQGNIINNAALIFANPAAQTYTGTISGSGPLTKLGGGTLVLSSSNTYTACTAINAGTVTAGAAETPGVCGPFGRRRPTPQGRFCSAAAHYNTRPPTSSTIPAASAPPTTSRSASTPTARRLPSPQPFKARVRA